MHWSKPFYLVLGWLSVGLAVLGIVMPILPTTPFLIVAVWAFSKSSPAMEARLRNNKYFGPTIRDWQDHGVIPASAKVAAVLMMGGASVYLVVWSSAPVWLAWGALIAMAAVGGYVLSRPSEKP